uniref:Uncharacterized protein n=1 Tax=Arundo donax TaxID=35708 RepID=A0A0A9E130_ARUDO
MLGFFGLLVSIVQMYPLRSLFVTASKANWHDPLAMPSIASLSVLHSNNISGTKIKRAL